MTNTQPLIVSYQEDFRAKIETALVQLSRYNALRSGILIEFWMRYVIGIPIAVVATGADKATTDTVIFFLAMLVPPAIGAYAVVWNLRHPPTLTAHVMTVTSTHVIFERRRSFGLTVRAKPRQVWDRSATRFVIKPSISLPPIIQTSIGSGFATSLKNNGKTALQMMLSSHRIEFYLEGGSRRQPWALPIDKLDVPVETIIAAIKRP